MPPIAEQQTPAPESTNPHPSSVSKNPGTTIKTIRIVLLMLIIVGIGLIATYKFWVPQLIASIIGNQSPIPLSSVATQATSSTPTSGEFPYGEWISLNELPNSQFQVKGGDVYISVQDYNGISQTVFPGADPSTFQVAMFPAGTSTTLGFLNGEPSSYLGWARDKNTVYHFADTTDGCVANNETINGSITFIPGTSTGIPSMKICIVSFDPSSFTPLYQGYMTGSGHVYGDDDDGLVIPNADPMTFRFIAQLVLTGDGYDQLFEADKNNLYADESIVQGADPSTFVLITDSNGQQTGYAKDKNNVYAYGISAIPGADPASFVVLDSTYAKDDQHVYTANPNVTMSTYPVIGWPIPGADSASFQIVNPPGQCGPNCQYDAQDKNHKYYLGQVVQ